MPETQTFIGNIPFLPNLSEAIADVRTFGSWPAAKLDGLIELIEANQVGDPMPMWGFSAETLKRINFAGLYAPDVCYVQVRADDYAAMERQLADSTDEVLRLREELERYHKAEKAFDDAMETAMRLDGRYHKVY